MKEAKINLGSYRTKGLKSTSSNLNDEPRYKISSNSIPEEHRLYLSDGKWMDRRDPILFYMGKMQQLLVMSH